MSMSASQLIGVDWGTTACRAYLIGADGAVLARIAEGPGILRVENGAFGAALRAMIDPWIAAHRALPILLSGMIGSRQGWVEVPYVACPAGSGELVAGLGRIDAPGFGPIAVVPGMTTTNGDMPDVMRGEETQVLGALASSGRADGLFLLPGTHSKWVEVVGGRIVAFRTFMTGEVFAALKDHTILGRLMQAGEGDADGFARGLAEGAALGSAGALLNRLFAARTYGLTDRLPGTALADFLSGLLIGAEIAAAMAGRDDMVTVVANPGLAVRYADALRRLGHAFAMAPDDCVAAGHWRLGAGLVRP
jgi:2-dehydro-3-deoxygalactonokinase